MGSNTREVRVGDVAVGGGAPVSVQSMANADPHDAKALLAQIESCAALGCDIFRLTVPDVAAAETLGVVRRSSPIPLVADIHFDYRCALAAIAAGTDALRLNPGNIGSRERVQAVVRAAKEKGVPIRIGVNLGSLEKDLRERLEASETLDSKLQIADSRLQAGDSGLQAGDSGLRAMVPELLCESALRHLKILEDEGFRDVVISAKASNVADTLATYRLLAERTDCPLHLGVTEAGTTIPGTVRNSVALGILLSEGIGDTIRVSLTDTPAREVRVGMEILRSLGLRSPGPAITSCPTCGRTKVGLFKVAAEVEEKLEKLYREVGRETRDEKHEPGEDARRETSLVSHLSSHALASQVSASSASPSPIPFPRVAVMGCVVNGSGEAKGADVALCGGDGEFVLYVHGEPVRKVSEAAAADEVIASVQALLCASASPRETVSRPNHLCASASPRETKSPRVT